MRRPLHARLRDDARGATIVEFAIVAPVMLLLLMGGFDVAHTLYTKGALDGIVQKAARDTALQESANVASQDIIDQRVRSQVKALVNDAAVDIKRRAYADFSKAAAAEPEPFTDTNGNRRCDAGEPYQDNNGDGTWDDDGGHKGQGGAKDAVVYTVTMTYTHLFPLWAMIGTDPQAKLTAVTVLRNQPYAAQNLAVTPEVRNCV